MTFEERWSKEKVLSACRPPTARLEHGTCHHQKSSQQSSCFLKRNHNKAKPLSDSQNLYPAPSFPLQLRLSIFLILFSFTFYYPFFALTAFTTFPLTIPSFDSRFFSIKCNKDFPDKRRYLIFEIRVCLYCTNLCECIKDKKSQFLILKISNK